MPVQASAAIVACELLRYVVRRMVATCRIRSVLS